MIDLFDEYARIAFTAAPGNKNPEKPVRSLENLERAFGIGELIRSSVDEYCWQHIDVERLHDHETTLEKLPHEDRRQLTDRFIRTRAKFTRLFNIGVFSLAVSTGQEDTLIIINLKIWDGSQYRPVTEVLEMVVSPEHSPRP